MSASRFLLILLLTLCFTSLMPQILMAQQLGGASTGVYPQSGMYWDSQRLGEGMFIEVQGNTVGFGIFTYREDGSPVFYTGGGPIQSLPFEEQRLSGFYPLHVITSDLVETRSGPIFSIDGGAGIREVEMASAGSARLDFEDENTVVLYVNLTGDVPTDRPRMSRRVSSRFAFGIGTFGSNSITPTRSCLPDLRGEWVFVDLSTPDRAPWRFNFTDLEVLPSESDIICPGINPQGLLILTYRDAARGAELRCVQTRSNPPAPPVPDPLDGRQKNACELRMSGSDDVLFWASRSDVGLKEITATLGTYRGVGHARGTARVTGFRVQ